MTELPEVGETQVEPIRKVVVNPGDTLVVSYAGRLTPSYYDFLVGRLRTAFGDDVKYVILDCGMQLSIVSSHRETAPGTN